MQFKYWLRFWSYVDKRSDAECWFWTGATDAWGRGVLTVQLDGKPYNLKAPRIAFWAAHDRWPAFDRLILHSCDTPICCNPLHLREGTQAENMRDAVARERVRKGSAHGMSKLTDENVRAIRVLASEGCSQEQIAERFGVSRSPIRALLQGRTWKHVK